LLDFTGIRKDKVVVIGVSKDHVKGAVGGILWECICDCGEIVNHQGFWNFLEDMGERPKDGSLDRSNNMLGYSKENCAWVTKKEQALNRGCWNNTGYKFIRRSEYYKAAYEVNVEGVFKSFSTYKGEQAALDSAINFRNKLIAEDFPDKRVYDGEEFEDYLQTLPKVDGIVFWIMR